MKTTKLILIAALMSFAAMSFATNEPAQNSSEYAEKSAIVKIKFIDAVQIRGLVMAMYDQLSPRMLQNEQNQPYVGKVVLNNTVYLISGSYRQWFFFFRDVNTDPVVLER